MRRAEASLASEVVKVGYEAMKLVVLVFSSLDLI